MYAYVYSYIQAHFTIMESELQFQLQVYKVFGICDNPEPGFIFTSDINGNISYGSGAIGQYNGILIE